MDIGRLVNGNSQPPTGKSIFIIMVAIKCCQREKIGLAEAGTYMVSCRPGDTFHVKFEILCS
jgi:hypothetical protein